MQVQLQLPAGTSMQNSEHQEVGQSAVPWVVTESELRETLHQYSQHRVLHFVQMGHVLMSKYRMWERRRSHATHENWRTTLFSAVD